MTGFDGVKGIKTGKRLQNWMKKQSTGRWCAWSQMKIRYTCKWKWNEREFLERYICHIGMLKYVKSVLKAEKCTHSLPKIVKEELARGSNVMAAKDVVVTCDDNGDQGFDHGLLIYIWTQDRISRCTKEGLYECFSFSYTIQHYLTTGQNTEAIDSILELQEYNAYDEIWWIWGTI